MFNPGDRVYVNSLYKEWCGAATVVDYGQIAGYLLKMDDGRDFVGYEYELFTLH